MTVAAGGQPGGSYEDARISQRRLQPKEMAIPSLQYKLRPTGEAVLCVCVCVHCDSMLVYVCVSSWVFICLPVCVSQCEGGIVHVSMYTRVCQRACVCVVVTAAESACPQAGKQLECEFP